MPQIPLYNKGQGATPVITGTSLGSQVSSSAFTGVGQELARFGEVAGNMMYEYYDADKKAEAKSSIAAAENELNEKLEIYNDTDKTTNAETYDKQYKTNFKTLIPCNLYGQNDNYDLNKSHFLSALIKKTHDYKIGKKKVISIWGDGRAKRELMHVDDLAEACVYVMNKKIKHDFINVGTGSQKMIIDYAKVVSKILEVKPKFVLDKTKPNGMKTKVLDITRIRKLGWKSKIDLSSGIKSAYSFFLKNYK